MRGVADSNIPDRAAAPTLRSIGYSIFPGLSIPAPRMHVSHSRCSFGSRKDAPTDEILQHFRHTLFEGLGRCVNPELRILRSLIGR